MRALIILLFLLLLSPNAYGEELNAGIVQGLWYANENVFADVPTRIYVAVRNNTGSDLTGTIEFFDGEKKIGRKAVQALNGHIVESWVDWTPSYGEHTLKANLSRIELQRIGSAEEEVEVISAIAEDTIFVDHDTDKDGSGNKDDEDDDNDNRSDKDEERDGTDPQVKDGDVEEEETVVAATTESTEEAKDPETTGPVGIERYLSDSPAEDALSRTTSFINTTKSKVDAYREKKATDKGAFENGFGEATTTGETAGIKELSLGDFFTSVFGLFKTLFGWVYTFALTTFSFVLGYPMLVQVGTLILILVLLFRTASKLGGRKRKI